MSLECQSELLQAAIKASTACDYVNTACTEYEIINFMYYKYCVLEADTGLNEVIFVLTMVVISYLVSSSFDLVLHSWKRGRDLPHSSAHFDIRVAKHE